MALTFDQFKYLRNQNLSPQQIADFENGKVPEQPKKEFSPLGTSKFGQVVSGIAKGGLQTVKDVMNTGEMLLKEKAKQTINQIVPGGTKLMDAAANKLGVSLTVPSMADTIQTQVEKNKGLEQGTLLRGNTPLEKGVKVGTEIATALAPMGGAKVASKAKEGLNIVKKVVTRSENLAEIVSPKLDKATRIEALSKGEAGVAAKGKSVFSKLDYTPDKEVIDMADRIKKVGVTLKNKATEAPKNVQKLIDAGKSEYNKVNEKINSYVTGKGSKYIPYDGETIVGNLETKINAVKELPAKKIELASDSEKIYDKIWAIAKETLQTNIAKTKGKLDQNVLLKTLRDWNYKASDIAAFEGKENIKKIAIKDIRKIFRETLIESLPKNTAKQVDEALKNQHAFIDAIENIVAKNESLVGKGSQASRAWSRTKKAAALIIGGSVIGGGAAALID